MDNIKILIVDDDADDYLLTCAHLGDISDKKFDIHWAANYVQGLAKINSIKPDICLFDFILGAKTGLNLLDDIRQSGNDVPVILLTGKGDTAIDRAAMTLGATDYLVKSDLNHTLLERSIRYALAHTANLRAVRTSEQLYRTIFEKSKNMIFLIDATSGRFSEVNPFGCALFGYDRDTFLNKLTARDLFPNAEIANFLFEILRDQHAITDYEITLVNHDGTRRQCLISVVLQKNRDGKKEFHGTLSDITALRQAEQGRLFTEKLAASGRFTRALAHEVRNPLTNITLSVEQMETEQLDEDTQHYISIIKRNAHRINNLITELLQTANHEQMQFAPHKINNLLEKTLEAAADRLALKGIKIVKNLTNNDPSVKADAGKLQMALLNIIINAAEAMIENTGILTLSTAENTDGTRRISVSDNGCGIPAEHLNWLFEPYFTGKKTGVGLGLATTLTIVQAHGGQIRVASELGKGTQFDVILPK